MAEENVEPGNTIVVQLDPSATGVKQSDNAVAGIIGTSNVVLPASLASSGAQQYVVQSNTTVPAATPQQCMTRQYTNPTYGIPQTGEGSGENAAQPQVIVITQPEEKPKYDDTPQYLQCAMLSASICCIPIGIVASIFAYKAAKRQEAGDLEGEKKYYRPAKYLTITSCLLGLIGYITIISIYAKYL